MSRSGLSRWHFSKSLEESLRVSLEVAGDEEVSFLPHLLSESSSFCKFPPRLLFSFSGNYERR